MDIKEVRRVVKKKGGECLSKVFSSYKMAFMCEYGHIWEATPYNIINSWCPKCAGNAKIEFRKIKDVAEKNRGKCISKYYEGGKKSKLKFRCSKGHEWEAIVDNILQGYWCPYCAGNAKGSLDEMHKIAKSRDGECLSKEYINNKTKLVWRCKNGHEWEATPTSIKGSKNRKGTWCRECWLDEMCRK